VLWTRGRPEPPRRRFIHRTIRETDGSGSDDPARPVAELAQENHSLSSPEVPGPQVEIVDTARSILTMIGPAIPPDGLYARGEGRLHEISNEPARNIEYTNSNRRSLREAELHLGFRIERIRAVGPEVVRRRNGRTGGAACMEIAAPGDEYKPRADGHRRCVKFEVYMLIGPQPSHLIIPDLDLVSDRRSIRENSRHKW